MTGEKRSLTRRRQLKSGMIFYNLRSFTLPCTVRDISETGARLRVDGTLVAPDTFELNIELDGLWAECEVVWRRGNEVGVHFASPPKINAPKRRQSLQAYIEPHKGHLLRRHDKGQAKVSPSGFVVLSLLRSYLDWAQQGWHPKQKTGQSGAAHDPETRKC